MREIRVSDLALESLRLNFGFGNLAIVKNLSVTKLEFDTQIDSVVGIVVVYLLIFSTKTFTKTRKCPILRV